MSLLGPDSHPKCPDGYELRCVKRVDFADAETEVLANLVDKLSREVSELGAKADVEKKARAEADLRSDRLQRQVDSLFDAYERLKTEKNAAISLWQRRAEAMVDPRVDSFFTEDENDWRKRAGDACREVGWLIPKEASELLAYKTNASEIFVALRRILNVADDECVVDVAQRRMAELASTEDCAPRRVAADLEDP